jgi:hypothetical protein
MTSRLGSDILENGEIDEPGQFEINKATIFASHKKNDPDTSEVNEEVDITSMIVSFNMYESIFNTFVTGDITLIDTHDLINGVLEITGTEPLYIEFGTLGSTYPIKMPFIITKVKESEKINESTIKYTLSLIPREFLTDARTKISRTEDGVYSDMVKRIFENDLKSESTLLIEATGENNRLIFPNISPVDSINMISQFAQTTSPMHGSDFLFFQTTKSFVFRSVEDMIFNYGLVKNGAEGGKRLEFRTGDTPPMNPGRNTTVLKSQFEHVIDFKLLSGFDTLRHTSIGSYNSSLINYDFRSKTWERPKPYNYHKAYSEAGLDEEEGETTVRIMTVSEAEGKNPITPHTKDEGATEDFQNMSGYPDAEINMVSSAGVYQYQDEPNDSPFAEINYNNFAVNRKARFNALNLQRAKITIYGISGIQAGDIIDMSIPKSNPEARSTPEEDKFLSGPWLIESVAHQVRDNYTCVLIVIRDSIPEELKPYPKNIVSDGTPKIIDIPVGSDSTNLESS